mgnify:CR=1 FL=1
MKTKYDFSKFTLIFKDPATTEIYTHSLHDALPISLTQTKKVDKTLTAKERIKAKSSQVSEDKKNIVNKVKEEIQLLLTKLKSQIPKLETYTITGRLFDQQTGNVLKGASVTLGVNTDTSTPPDVNLPVDSNLISNLPDLDFPDLVYITIPIYKTKTDKKGERSEEHTSELQ